MQLDILYNLLQQYLLAQTQLMSSRLHQLCLSTALGSAPSILASGWRRAPYGPTEPQTSCSAIISADASPSIPQSQIELPGKQDQPVGHPSAIGDLGQQESMFKSAAFFVTIFFHVFHVRCLKNSFIFHLSDIKKHPLSHQL